MKAVIIVVIVNSIQGDFAYALTSSIISTEDFSDVSVYGICITSLKDKKHNAAVEDISDDFLDVYRLFGVMVAEKLHPEHLMSVVEDYLSDKDSKVIPITGYLEHHIIL